MSDLAGAHSNVVTSGSVPPHIRSAFERALRAYPELQNVSVELRQMRIDGSTMQARPLIRFKSLFTGIDAYQIRLAEFVRDSESMAVRDLPEPVLCGWFAHELGHVLDYQDYSAWGMILYGIRYLTSSTFRKDKEHRADLLALQHGMHNEILAAKKFLFYHELISPTYRSKMQRFYMSETAVQEWIQGNVTIDEVD